MPPLEHLQKPTDSDESRAGSPAAVQGAPRQIRILTYNVWGLAFFSKARTARMAAIAARLVNSPYDVVVLQEIWCENSDWQEIKSRSAPAFPHSKFFYTGAFGSGLAILSKFPLVSTHTHPYSLNGHPVYVQHGDWIVAKAAGCATLDVAGLGLLDVWVTHTVAAGGEDGPESRRAHRITQAYELASFAKQSAAKGRHVICAGDFNSTPPSLCMAILRDVGMLSDAFIEAHPDLPAHAVSLPGQSRVRPDPHRSIEQLGVTCDSPLNTWTAGKKLDDRARRGAGKRLDYILFRGPTSLERRTGRLSCKESRVVFTELMDDLQVSYSDHFGVEATFDIDHDATHAAQHALPMSSTQSSRLAQTLTSSLSSLSAALVASRREQRSHMFLFFAVLVLAAVSIGLAGTSTFGAFWAFVTLVCGWAGTTLLYSTVIWGEWEKRTLRTFLEVMELDLATQRQSHSQLSKASSHSSSHTHTGSTSSDGPTTSAHRPHNHEELVDVH